MAACGTAKKKKRIFWEEEQNVGCVIQTASQKDQWLLVCSARFILCLIFPRAVWHHRPRLQNDSNPARCGYGLCANKLNIKSG